MRKKFLTLFLLLFALHAAGQTLVYHVTNGNDSGPGSLRQAVTDANANPGGDVINFDNNFTIILNSEILITENITIHGNGIGNTTIDGGGVTRIFRVNSSGPAAINNMTIQNGSSTDNGGGIYSSSTLYIDNCRFANNTAELSGGGIFISSVAPSASLTNVVVENNSAKNKGGGIYSDVVLTLNGSTISGNKSGYNAATGVFAGDNSGGGVYANDGLILQGAIIFDKNMAAANGGAILKNATGDFTTTDLTSLVVSRNSAITGFGGGIYSGAVFGILNGTITDNSAAQQAGGIYAVAGLTLESCTVSGNKAGYNVSTAAFSGSYSGGGLYAYDALTLKKGILFENNTASGSGGGIWKNNVGVFATSEITTSSFNENTAMSGTGGGIHSGVSFSTLEWNVTNNHAGTTGGGINITTGGTLTLIGGAISGNTAKTNGGGVQANGNLVVNNVNISNNIAGYNSTDQTGNGGGIYASGNLTMLGANIINNNSTAGHGGGIYKTNGTFITDGLSSLSISGNKTLYGNGGGLYTTIALSLTGTVGNPIQIANNRSAGEGGGIYTSQRLVLNRADILSNYAAAPGSSGSNIGGGGICGRLGTDTVFLTNVNVSNNTAFADGGGILYRYLTLKNVTISNNKAGYNLDANTVSTAARGHGGGIACASPGGPYILTLKGSITVEDNSTKAEGGGIWHSSAGNLMFVDELTSLAVNRNRAGSNGGGMVLSGSTAVTGPAFNLMTANHVVVTNNVAGAHGGGIYSSYSAPIYTFDGATITGNTAGAFGGGLYVIGDGLILSNINLSNNKAGYDDATQTYKTTGTGGGGGVYAGATTFALKGHITIQNNSAAKDGGGICKNYGTFNVNEATSILVSQNKAGLGAINSFGGGIYTSVPLTLTGSNNATIVDNAVYGSGGGIYATAALVLDGLRPMTGNWASTNGGAVNAVAALTLKDMTISNNRAGFNILTGAYTTSSYSGGGGGIAVYGSLALQGNVVFQNDTTSAGHGGAIYTASTLVVNTDQLNSLVVSNNATINNTNGNGGGIYSYSGLTLNGNNNITIENNSASGNGGSIFTSGALTLSNIPILRNSTSRSGGAIYSSGAATLTNVAVTNNSAVISGGGIYAGNVLTLQRNILVQNNTTAGSGGGIYKGSSGTVTTTDLDTLTITGNTALATGATTGGGGIFATGALLSLTNGSIILSNNTSAAKAGAIYANNGLALSNATVTGNKSAYAGGAIYIYAGTATITGSNLSDNISKNEAGAVYAESTGSGVPLTLQNTTISNNKAGYDYTAATPSYSTTNYYGGGVYAGNVLTLIGDITFENNTTSGSGGAIYKNTIGTFTTNSLTSLALNGNRTVGSTGANGGGIYTAATLALTGSSTSPVTITNNSASGSGGGIYATNNLTIDSLSILDNTAASNGGAIYKSGSYTMGIKASTLARNSAANGGGIYTLANALNELNTITNSTFIQNRATTGNGGAIYSSGTGTNASVAITLSTFNGNTANTGNAIYFANPSGKKLSGSIVYGNGTGGSEINNTAALDASYNIVRNQTLPGTTNLNLANSLAGSIFTTTSGDIATPENNGGPTLTLNIKRGGYAQNLIPIVVSNSWGTLASDQTGNTRIVGCKTDAGAVEVQTPDDPATATIKNITAICYGSLLNPDTLVVSTVNIKDTVYYSDKDYTQEITTLPVAVTTQSNIYVKFTSNNNCEIYDSLALNVIPEPTITIAIRTVAECSGAMLSLAATTANTSGILWTGYSSTGTATGETTNALTYTSAPRTSDTTFYIYATVQGISPCGAAVDSVRVTLYGKPTITVSTPAAVCEPATVDVAGSASGATTYKYYADNSGVVGAELASTIFTGAQITNYWIIGTLAQGCTSDAVQGTVTIKAKPVITVTSPIAICEPAVVNITGSANGASTYKYYADNSGVVGAELSSTTFTGAQVTNYWVIGTSAQGCNSDPVQGTVTINAKSVITVTSPTSARTPATVNVLGTATGANTYKYYSNAAATTELASTVFSGAQITGYWVVGFPIQGCASDPVQGTVAIYNEPVVTATGTNGTCTANGSITVSAVGTTGTVLYAIKKVSDADFSTQQVSNTFSNLESGTYIVMVYDSSGATLSNQVTIVNAPYVPIVVSKVTPGNAGITGCTDDGVLDVSISGGTAPFSYQLKDGPSAPRHIQTAARTVKFMGLSTGIYSLDITDACGNTITTPNISITSKYNIAGYDLKSFEMQAPTLTSTGCDLRMIFPSNNAVVTAEDGTVLFWRSPTPNKFIPANYPLMMKIEYPSGSKHYLSGWHTINPSVPDVIPNYAPTSADPKSNKYRILVKHPCNPIDTVFSPEYTIAGPYMSRNGACAPYVDRSIPTYNCGPVTIKITNKTNNTITRTYTWDDNNPSYTLDVTDLLAGRYAVSITISGGYTYASNDVDIGSLPIINTAYIHNYISTLGCNFSTGGFRVYGISATDTIPKTYTITSGPVSRPPITGVKDMDLWTDLPAGTYEIKTQYGSCGSSKKTLNLVLPYTGFQSGTLAYVPAPTCGKYYITGTAWYIGPDGATPSTTGSYVANVYTNSGTFVSYVTATSNGAFTTIALDPGTYKITFQSSSNSTNICSYTQAEKYITIPPYTPLAVDVNISGGITCQGGLGELHVGVTGGSGQPVSYRIKQKDSPDNSYTPYQASPDFPNLPAGSYTVQVKDECGYTSSQDLNITASSSGAHFDISGIDVTSGEVTEVCPASDITLSLRITGRAANLWWTYPNGTAVNTPSATISKFSSADEGKYKVVYEASGCLWTDSITLRLKPSRPDFTLSNPDAACNSVSLITLNVTSGSIADLTLIYWNNDYSENVSSTANAISLPGIYHIQGTNIHGCSDTATVNVIIPPKPVITVTSPTAVCEPSTVDIAGSASGAATYKYYADNTGSMSAELGSTIFAGTQVTNYWVVGTSAQGCISNAVMGTVAITTPPVPTISGSSSVCANATGMVYSTESGMASYQWSINGGTIISGQGSNSVIVSWGNAGSASISVSYTNTSGCSAAAATVKNITVEELPVATITGHSRVHPNSTGIAYSTETAMSDYQWVVSGGTIVSGQGTSSIKVDWGTDGIGNVRVSYTILAGCSATASLDVEISTLTMERIIGDQRVCANATGLVYSTIENMSSYQWLVTGGTITDGQGTSSIKVDWNVSGEGDVSVRYLMAVGNYANASLAIIVNAKPADPTITSESASGTNNIRLSAVSSGLAYSSSAVYTWYRNGSPVAGQTGSTINVTESQPCTYSVMVDDKGCASNISTAIDIRPSANVPTPSIAMNPANGVICGTGSITLSAQGSYSGTEVYTWYKNDVVVSGQTAATLVVTERDPGSYTVMVADQGVSSEKSSSAVVKVIATVSLSARDDAPMGKQTLGKQVTISVSPTGLPGYTFNFDGKTVKQLQPTYPIYQWQPKQPNTVTISTDADGGCVVNITHTFTGPEFDLPNIIVPGSNPPNDRLLRGYNIKVFNRWGSELYHGKEGWDGTYLGKRVTPGTYFYIITVDLPDGSKMELKHYVYVKEQ